MSAKILEHFNQTEEQTVKRLLRHLDSQQYFKDGEWTCNPEEADSFCDIVDAAEACARHNLTRVELALRLDCQASDVFCTPIR